MITLALRKDHGGRRLPETKKKKKAPENVLVDGKKVVKIAEFIEENGAEVIDELGSL